MRPAGCPRLDCDATLTQPSCPPPPPLDSLERIVQFYLNLGNIRRASLFPRDPTRLEP